MSWVGVGAAAVSVVGSQMAGDAQSEAASQSRRMQRRQERRARGDLAPYREFGEQEMAGFQDWLSSQEGQYRDPTMEEVQAGPGYETRLGAIESSAAARGGLLSGNALRDIGEFGASEFGRERSRRRENYMDEFNRRMQRVNLGYGAAGGSAGLTSSFTPGMAQTYGQQGAARAGAYQGMGSAITGAAGSIQGQNMWDDYMNNRYAGGVAAGGSAVGGAYGGGTSGWGG